MSRRPGAARRQPTAHPPRSGVGRRTGRREHEGAAALTGPASVRVLGVDACPTGWVGVELHDGVFLRAVLTRSLFEVVAASSGIAVIGANIPLGLLPDRWRAAEVAAAARLGPLRGTVLPVAPRPVWQETEFAAANRRCRELTGSGLSRQSWALRAKLLEANAIWDRHPGLLFEAHPEVSFATMAGAPLTYPKRSWTGQARRQALLAAQGVVLPATLGPAGEAPPEDVLDAAAVAWSAHRVASGKAGSHPDPPEEARGSPVAIWY